MPKTYTAEECRRKANQQWELAGLARQDRDHSAEKAHTKAARLWDERAKDGGHEDHEYLKR